MGNKYYDLVYHVYEWEEYSKGSQKEFRELVKKNFPGIKMEDAYDHIKGYRTAIYADENFDVNVYYSFLLAFGFSGCSLSFLWPDKKEIPSQEEVIKIIRERWPECLKEEYR